MSVRLARRIRASIRIQMRGVSFASHLGLTRACRNDVIGISTKGDNMRLPTNLEELRSSKLIKIVAGGSALAVGTVAVAQALDGGSSPDVATIGLQNDDQRGDDVKLDLEGNTVAVPADILLADGVDDTNDSPDDSQRLAQQLARRLAR
jgi:hypothetical protein